MRAWLDGAQRCIVRRTSVVAPILLGLLCALAGCGTRGGSLDSPWGDDGSASKSTGVDDASGEGQEGGSPAVSPSGAAPGSLFGGSSDGGEATGSACAQVMATLKRIVPNVWLMIDGSGSMTAPLQGAASRYGVLRDALIDPTAGLVHKLQDSIAFGLFVYDGCAYDISIVGPGCVAGACPRVISLAPALHAFDSIAALYPQAPPGASTPTDVALSALGQRIGTSSNSTSAPTYVVLATDGEPNLCDWHDGVPSNPMFQQNALTAVQTMAMSGTKVFAISLAGGDAQLEAYLNQVAAAGGTGQSAFTPNDPSDLAKALQSILGGAVSCDIRLNGTVAKGDGCNGTVTLDGKPLACNDANGWHLKDHQTIELAGSACGAIRTDPTSTVGATFPCDVYHPLQ